MNLDLLHPAAGNHAVQNVAFGVEWLGDLSDQTLLRVRSLSEQPEFKAYFQKVELQKVMKIDISLAEGQPQTPASPSSSLGGIVFQRLSELGAVARQLAVSRSSCVFVIHDYDRWAPTLQIVSSYFDKIFPIILADKAISAIVLQYTDAFIWKDDPNLLQMNEVFLETSPYLPSNAFSSKYLWHSHHGFVTQVSDPVEFDGLDNMMVNINDVAGERTIQITTVNKATLKKPLRLSTPDYRALVESLHNALHSRSKDMLINVLSPAVARKIGLQSREE